MEWVEEALQWVHDNQFNFENPITTVNLSLGTAPGEFYQEILNDEFAQLEADGIFVSVAAGNNFDPQFSSELAYPASSPSVVPVASVNSDGELSDFSQRASNVLTAPGEGIVSTVPESLFFGSRSDPFVGASGTSQAAPYVAGVSALLRQANEIVGTENIDQDLLYSQLVDTADQVFDSVTGNYFAQVNLQAALESVFAGSTNAETNQTQAGESSATNSNTPVAANGASFATVNDGVLTIAGTQQNDSIHLEVKGRDASQLSVVLNGQSQDFTLSQIQQIVIQGNGGEDTLSVKLGDGVTSAATNDVVTLRHRQVDVLNEFFTLSATNIANATIDNGAGADSLVSQGSSGSDQLSVTADQITFQNSNFRASTGQYTTVYANGQQGSDSVEIEGTAGDDLFAERDRTSYLETDSQTVFVEGFEQVNVDGNGGNDRANLGATNERESFELDHRDASIEQAGRTVEIEDFGRINVTGADGGDTVSLRGSTGNDTLYGRDGSATFLGQRFLHFVSNFESLSVESNGGNDTAYLAGSRGDDQFQFSDQHASIQTENTSINVSGFDLTVARSGGGGHDTASFNGTDGAQRYYAGGKFIQSTGEGQATGRTIGYDAATVDGAGGADVVDLIGGDGDDSLTLNQNDVEFETTLQMLRLVNVERSNFFGGEGVDTVQVNDVENLDLIAALGDGAQAALQKHTAYFEEVENLEANAVDDAIAFYDLEKVDFQYDLRGRWNDAE